jgi:hypothetical protein
MLVFMALIVRRGSGDVRELLDEREQKIIRTDAEWQARLSPKNPKSNLTPTAAGHPKP